MKQAILYNTQTVVALLPADMAIFSIPVLGLIPGFREHGSFPCSR